MGNHPCTGLTFFPVCRQTSALLTKSQESELSKKCAPLWVREGKQGQTKMKSRKTEKTHTSGFKRQHSSEDIEPFAFEIASDSFSFPAWTHAQLFLQDPAPNAHGTRTEFPAGRGVEFSVGVELAPSVSGQYENVASTALSRWNSTTANQSGTGLTPEHLAARTALLGGQARLNANCSPRPTISNQSVTDEQVTPLLPSSNQEIETKCQFINSLSKSDFIGLGEARPDHLAGWQRLRCGQASKNTNSSHHHTVSHYTVTSFIGLD